MKRPRSHRRACFTLIELLVVIAVVVLLVLVVFPNMARARNKAKQIQCVSRHKQIAISFRIWGGDNGDKYPMFVSVTNGGTLEVSNDVWRTVLVMSNEIGTPLIPACPSDDRQPATNWNSLANSNISYFICLDADEAMPNLPLMGDRFLDTGRPTVNKVLTITTNDTPDWASRNHRGGGNIALSDGSAQQYTAARMREWIKVALVENREARTNATLRLAKPE